MKFLIIKTSAYGDIVHTFPAIQLIRKLVPDAVIDWVVEKQCQELVLAHPLVDQTLVIETKKWRKSPFASWMEIKHAVQSIQKRSYDVIFDFQGNLKSGIIMGLARGNKKVGFGKKSVAELPNLLFSNHRIELQAGLNIREDYLSLVEEVFGKKGDVVKTLLHLSPSDIACFNQLPKPTGVNILVCPGSNWENKRLSNDTWIELLTKIESHHPCKFWILQGNDEEKVFADLLKSKLKQAEVMPYLSLPALQHWMLSMNLVIAMDSLPLHLAGESGVPTLSAFGPSLRDKYRPFGGNSLQGYCPYNKQFAKRCPILRSCQTGACIKKISAEDLFAEIHIQNWK